MLESGGWQRRKLFYNRVKTIIVNMEKHYKLKNIVTNLIDEVKKQDFLVYFRKISAVEITEKKLVLGVVSTFMKDNLQAKFYSKILEAVQKEIVTITEIEFVVDQEIDNPSNTAVVDCTAFYKTASKTKKGGVSTVSNVTGTKQTAQYKQSQSAASMLINQRYKLKNFVFCLWSCL